jgi:hypothetical protein
VVPPDDVEIAVVGAVRGLLHGHRRWGPLSRARLSLCSLLEQENDVVQ